MNTIKKDLLKGKTILIADDEEYLREVIGERLKICGATVLLAQHGREAHEIFQKNEQIDFIISDVRMPGGDGVSLLHSIKETGKATGRPLPPFLFITGFADINHEQAKKLGALGLLNKPFQIQEVVNLILKS
ncbi:MAG: response regulator [Oligoflexia bacterium]|nr:response regulator [Oligoflexia bacterium]